MRQGRGEVGVLIGRRVTEVLTLSENRQNVTSRTSEHIKEDLGASTSTYKKTYHIETARIRQMDKLWSASTVLVSAGSAQATFYGR